MAISSLGISSGINFEEILSQTRSAQSKKLTPQINSQVKNQQKIDAFVLLQTNSTNISASLSKLKAAKNSELKTTDPATYEKNLMTEFENVFTGIKGMVGNIRSYSSYNPTTKKGEVLTGDSTTGTVRNIIRETLSENVSDNQSFKYLSNLGIQFNSKGELEIDMTKAAAKYKENPDEFAAAVETIYNKLNSKFSSFSGTTGIFQTRKDSLEKINSSINSQILRTQEIIDKNIEGLKIKFISLEKQISVYQRISGSLTTSLSALMNK